MDSKSNFGADPERIDRLLMLGLENSNSVDETDLKTSSDFFTEKPGSWIGKYKLLSVLGEGGMGVVYLAEQAEPIQRRVAMKVIKPGMDSKRVIGRLEVERQALALLDHLNIAHVYDAGTTETGRPYFVMEYVKGLSITEHCDHHKLTIDQRLRLFQQVCQAVQHAHQKGIIHRDIKPSNILVSMEADRANPKIIDFGVAKALSQPLTERTLITEACQLLGTPEYMSPEQIDMANEDIDTRSDIYSLGVLLYELLTGVLPFDSDALRTGGIENIRKIIRETDPNTPSTRLTKLGEKATSIAQNRRMEIHTLTRHLKKELEWIPLKAMRKERSERYRSASELADDVENYLLGNPLMAGPVTTAYRVKKFVRRNRTLVAGVVAVGITLMAGLIVSTALYFRAEALRVEAQLIADFLENDVLGAVSGANVDEATFSYALEAAGKSLESKFEDKPLVKASIHHKLGMTYRALHESAKAEQHLECAWRIRREHLGAMHLDTLKSMEMLGWVYRDQSRLDDAEKLWSRQLEIIRKEYGEEHEMAMDIMNHLANTYGHQGRPKEAEEMFCKVLEINERVRGDRYFTFIAALNLGAQYSFMGRYEAAQQLLTEALEVARQRWGLKYEEGTLKYTMILANLYRAKGQYGEAEQLLETTLETARQKWGTQNWTTLQALLFLGGLRTDQGHFDEAERLLREALKGYRLKLGNTIDDEYELPPQAMNALVVLLMERKQYDEAASLLQEALRIRTRLLSDNSSGILEIKHSLAMLHTRQGEYDDANDLFTTVLKGKQDIFDRDHPRTLETLNGLGMLRREQQRYEEAEKLLIEALEARQIKLGDDHPSTLESKHELAILYKEQAKYEEAEKYFIETVEGRRLKLGDTHPHTLGSINNLINLYEAWNKPEEAEKWRAKMSKTEAVEE
jgi:serine/threonine protein kinase